MGVEIALMVDHLLARLNVQLAALPELRAWTIRVFRDPDGRIACTVTHRLGSYQFGTGALDNEEGFQFILQAIKSSPLIARLNAAPESGDPRILNGLRAGKRNYGWGEAEFKDLLAAFQSTGRIGPREVDWLLAVSQTDAQLWPRVRHAAHLTASARKSPGRTQGSLAPSSAEPILPETHMSVDEETAQVQQRLTGLSALAGDWSVRVLRSPGNGFVCLLHHPCLVETFA